MKDPAAHTIFAMVESARVIVEVQAGVIPGTAETEHTRRWVLSSSQWHDAEGNGTAHIALAELNGKAQGYAMLLMLQPDRFNWVRTDWLWV